ncbi:MAG: hypothetical protein Q9180_007694, partial [Flavoplaca navasiana]
MDSSQRIRASDTVKLELSLSNGQYEAIYGDIANKMRDRGILGNQMRSIQAKAEARQIGSEIRRLHQRTLSNVLDATFDKNIVRIIQRINNNARRVNQRAQARSRLQERKANNERVAIPKSTSNIRPEAKPQEPGIKE